MLDIQGTLEKFGYNPSKLKRYSERVVIICCNYCGQLHETLFCRYAVNTNITCGSKECKNKLTEQTCLEKYGVKHHLSADNVKAKRKRNNLAKYGVEHIAQIAEIREKIKASNITSYNEKDTEGNFIIVEKIKTAHQAKYGVDFAFTRTDIREKIKTTNLAKYGAETPFSSEICRLKGMQTKIARYGSLNSSGGYGRAQQEMADWLQQISGKVFAADLKLLEKREIDLYNAELKIGIEYCGLYWHTEDSRTPRDRNYHATKFEQAKAKGVRLITVYEDEWLYRQPQVKNFLRAVLGANQHTVYARKCEVRQITKEEARLFFEQHHIQGGNSLGKHFAGLFHDNLMLAAMSFGRHHRKSSQLVLDRFAVYDNYNITGGASKLFRFLLALSSAQEVISWSDNRWSWGNVYSELGFQLEASLPPDYSYVDFSSSARRLSKQSQRKSKTNCPADMTEKEFSKTKNLHRLWDCGKLRWLFRK